MQYRELSSATAKILLALSVCAITLQSKSADAKIVPGKKTVVQAKGLGSVKYAVQVSAKIQNKPPQIALSWPAENSSYSYTVYRRFLGEKQWNPTPVAVLDGKATGYIDNKVNTGIIYEYRIDRAGNGYIGSGYICSGIEAPFVEKRGSIILLVEKSLASQLKLELTRLELDLIGDGWQVIRHDVEADVNVSDVKKLIETDYAKDPDNVKSVFLFGRIPVPYSGNIFPDGHTNHRGAWPADLYYGDMNGKWTDTETHKFYPDPILKNVPGDGKFDKSSIEANSIELEVGRVDLSNMPAFALDEVELLRQYLNKDHFFRHGLIPVAQRGLVDDGFGGFKGEAFGSSAWLNFATFFGADNVTSDDWFTVLSKNSYLWSYGCGGGSHDRAGGIGTTADFAKTQTKSVFTMLFGSYFGDWNRPNNFLRAPLANSGYGLTCAWDGRPHWYFHHMAMGKNIGYSTLRTQNNNALQDYIACNDAKSSVSGKDEDSEWEYNPVHVALMGDPTLRMHPVAPPRQSSGVLERATRKMKLKWFPSPDKNVIGYHIFRADFIDSPYSRLTDKPVTATEYIVSEVKPEQVFMVKAVALQKSASGSYFNSSQGIFIPQPFEGLSYYAPETTSKKLSALEDVPTEIDLPQANGTDGVQLWSVSLPPEHGTLTQNGAGKYVYSPTGDYAGKDKFSFVAWDGMADSNPAEFTVDVLQVPDNPRPVNQTICLTDNAPIKVTLAATDPEEPAQKLTYKMTKLPNYGKLSGTPPAMTYYPQAELKNADEFQFTANDGALESNPGTIKIIPPFICAKSSEPKIVDGKLDDWKVLPISCNEPELFRLMGKKAWKGPADCSFAIGVAYDDKYLYIAVEVIDDQYNAVKDKNPWDQDGIEIRLDARPANLRSANTGKNEMKDFLLLALSPSASASEPWLYKATKDLPAGTKYACVSNLKGFNTEIAIPLSYLNKQAGKEWDGFRLNVTVNDQDADKQVQLCWKPDWRAPESYPGSGSFIRPQPSQPKKPPTIPPAAKKPAPVVAATKPAAPATATTKPAAPAH